MKITEQRVNEQKILGFTLEVSGCKHACEFCWADGHYYPLMALQDIERIVEQVAEFCRSEHLKFEPYPMHEVLGHPDTLRIIQLIDRYCKGVFEPLPTSGLALSTRRDRDGVLNSIKSLGVKTFWFTFHGIGDVHNRIVHYDKAFAVTTRAVRLCREAGFRCGANILITKENVKQISEIVEFAGKIGLDEIGFAVTDYRPIPRLRKYEAIRPELVDLISYAEFLQAHSRFWKEKWGNLSKYTEDYYVQAAFNPQNTPDMRWSYFDENRIDIVCRSNQALYIGRSGQHGHYCGNFAKGDIQQTLRDALKASPYPEEKLYFPDTQIPAIADLARDVGNPMGQRVYFDAVSMYLRWLDLFFGLGKGKRRESKQTYRTPHG